MSGRSVHRTSTAVLSVSMAILGIVLLVEAFAAGGVSLIRLLLGVLFVAAGSGRLYLLARRRDA
jgi:hypothetical protein